MWSTEVVGKEPEKIVNFLTLSLPKVAKVKIQQNW